MYSFILFVFVLHLHCCSGVYLVVASVGYSLVAVHKLLVTVASLFVDHGLRDVRASVAVACRLSSCLSWPLEHRLNGWLWRTGLAAVGTWGLPEPGIEPVSPSLACRFFTSEPLGKPSRFLFCLNIITHF